MHNANPINSNMALITENITGHNSCALTNGIKKNCVMQQPAPHAGKEWGVSELNPPPARLCTTVTIAVSYSANCPDTFPQRKWMRGINPLFALYLMWQPCIWFYAFFYLERKLRALLGNTQDLGRREQRIFSSVWQDCVKTLINTKPMVLSLLPCRRVCHLAQTQRQRKGSVVGESVRGAASFVPKSESAHKKFLEIHPDGSRWSARFDCSNQILNIALLQYICLSGATLD